MHVYSIENHLQKMNVAFKTVENPVVIKGFEASRKKLIDSLQQHTFMRVTTVSCPSSAVREGTHFQGEATEIFAGRGTQNPRNVFFSRFGRHHGGGFSFLGAFNLIDCPVGSHHASAIPQVGDILVGSVIAAKKGKLPWELRGWSNNAKPLLELLRIVQYGSRMSEKEICSLLRQPASTSANAMIRLKTRLSDQEKTHAENAVASTDDVWFIARTICFGRLDEDVTLKLSKNWVELIDTMAMKFDDDELLTAWGSKRPQSYIPEDTIQPKSYVSHEKSAGAPYSNLYAAAAKFTYAPPPVYSFQSIPKSTTPPPQPMQYASSQEYVPSSPLYEPQEYAPQSPIVPKSPEYEPKSPVQLPK